jgi:hypothetical protein
MTKGLPSQLFLDFRYSLYVRPPNAQTAGDVRVYFLYRIFDLYTISPILT